MKKLILFSLLFAGFALFASAQNINPEEVKYFNASHYNGKITISQDPQLENFIETHVGLNNKRSGFYGYRVKIYAQNHKDARSQANAIKIGFSQDGQKAYLGYTEPNFEVLVGDYTDRFGAVKLYHKIKAKYPEAYVVKTVVSYPTHD
ncbi:MAG: hypothetical protein PHE56_01355 [Bacteroidales bacterium]|nr:hypothetical protein [Bacteroidales bacterium]